MSYHRTATPSVQWRETHNANVRNGAGAYRRGMTGPILPIVKRKWWQL